MRRELLAGLIAFCVVSSAALAQSEPPVKPAGLGTVAEKGGEAEAAKSEASVTEHTIRIGDQTVAYTATAGTLVLRDEKGAPTARMGYTAYTRKGVGDASRRPITFAFNGGPGSSSIWLHMGALGPRRVVTADAASTPPPPYRVVDNAYSVLDVTDLVMIDPVGTGLSHALGKKEDKDFWGVDPDLASVAQFIFQYVDDNDRWNSPKYLLGESYGTTRAAGLVNLLQSEKGMAFNGVVLVSVAVDLGAIFDQLGNDRAFVLYLPTFTAVAWYHHVLPERPDALEPLLQEARRFAAGPYAEALMRGDTLTDAERDAIAQQIHRFTGLAVDYIKKANLRVREGEFTQELLREHREIVGRLDARFLGVTPDPLAQDATYDPQEAAISPAFTAAFMDYLHRELKFGRDRAYRVEAQVFQSWSFTHRVPGLRERWPQPVVNTGVDLAQALIRDPNLRVLALNGYFDLATPFFGTEYMLSHLGLPRDLAGHVEMRYYEAGHMMYLHEPDLAKMKADVASFIGATAHEGGEGRR
ncbi:MAG: S10 family peptidase [Acidobacteriota bacterium]